MAVESVSIEQGQLGPGQQPDSVFKDWYVPLTGLGQIMFQGSPLTGAFFLTGIALVSPLVAAGAVAGSVIGTITAYVLHYDRDETRNGIYGFNSALVGIALLAREQPQFLTFALILVGSIVATLLTYEMRQRLPVPCYTAPFVVTTWVALYIAHEFKVPDVVESPYVQAEQLDLAAAVVRGISEVMFQTSVLTGVLFLVGIMLCSWRCAFWAMMGSLVGLLTGLSHEAPEANLSLGIYGYNAALAAMALALYRRSVMLPIFGALMSVPFTEKIPLLGLPTLTSPFVLASWIVIAMDRLDGRLFGMPQKPSN